ncbi:MAG: DNA adenine methylase [Acidobacteriaceae bacterium]|jgi:adenine-specific DNA methylase
MNPKGGKCDVIPDRISAWRGCSLIPESLLPGHFGRLQESAAECGIDFRCFPSTRYQGSKRKVIPWLWEHISGLDFSSALDVFGGTGSVSYLFKRMGKRTTYNDYLRFNYEIGKGLIENDGVVLTEDDIEKVATRSPRRCGTFVRKTFKDIYFTDEENEWIDRAVAHIDGLSDAPYKQALLRYALFQSCLVKRPFNLFHRRNLYVRLAIVDRRFGNKTTWDRPFGDVFSAFCLEANAFVFRGDRRCRALCHDALEVPVGNYDLVYIDPPYLRRDRRDGSYISYYHFLEGLCRYTEWETLIDYGTNNLRMKSDVPDSWADQDKRIELLDALFDRFKTSILALSYKRFGVPSIDTLIRMLRRHGRKVQSHSRHYKYALNHQNGSADLNREVLLIAE